MKIKKICIGIIIILVAIILFCVGKILLKNKNNELEITSVSNNILLGNDLNNEVEVVIENETQNIITNEQNEISNVENVVEDKKEQIQSNEEEKKQEIKQENIPQATTPSISKPAQETQQSKPVAAEQPTTKPTTQEEVQIETPTQSEKPPVTEKEETQEKTDTTTTVVPQNVEKFVRNDTMIDKIKQVIENNPSENMKKFGYQIVIDPSIKELTNQFTFYESRVINSIKYSFGTIKIYAEDYYYNGNLVMTECYIL